MKDDRRTVYVVFVCVVSVMRRVKIDEEKPPLALETLVLKPHKQLQARLRGTSNARFLNDCSHLSREIHSAISKHL